MNTIKAWHFVGDRLRDGRPVPADGVKLIHPGDPVICASGLHASRSAFDALRYAPGDTLCLVECGGIIIEQDDKLVCTERTIVTRMDAAPLLRHFARQQALSVLHLWQTEPDQAVLDYLMGDDAAALAAARSALAAARSAELAVRSAELTAWTTGAAWMAEEAARSAALAWVAELTEAAELAAWKAAQEMFDSLVNECFEDFL